MIGLQGQRGAFLPIVAFMLVALILLVGLVVDLGHIYNVKTKLQRAVDASALAGAHRLTGDTPGEMEDNATAAANATAILNTLDNRQVDIVGDQVTVIIGDWDQTALGADIETRFQPHPGAETIDAVKVTATTNVEPFFFVWLPDALLDHVTVSVEAIALKQPELLTLPLAVISCLPPTGAKTGELDLCGIKTYTFSSNKNTAGWTALTLGGKGGASQQEIADFFTGEGAELFNSVVKELEKQPIFPPEFLDTPLSYTYKPDHGGCEGNEGASSTSIECGLGGEYVPIDPIPPGDPLERYADDAFPRLITLSDTEQQAFINIATQDGTLLPRTVPDPGEEDSEVDDPQLFQQRLERLYTGNGVTTADYESTVVNPDRFRGNIDGERLIKYDNDKFDFDQDGSSSDKVYIPDLNAALDYAGYPPVSATTGNMATVMQALLDQITKGEKGGGNYEFSPTSLSKKNAPFDGDPDWPTPQGTGTTIKFTVPVIFAGICGGFDPKSHESSKAQTQEDNELHYVGLANFIVTRIVKGGQCFDNFDPVTPDSEQICSGTDDQSMGLSVGDDGIASYQCPEQKSVPSIAFEGLIRPPGLGGEDDKDTGVIYRVFLVK